MQVWAGKGQLGLHRSPLQPEETRSLTRSGDISAMLPSEAHLLAASAPKTEGMDLPQMNCCIMNLCL